MTDFDFDTVIDRGPWHQLKTDPSSLRREFGTDDVIPAWVADMDFKVCPAVTEAIRKAADHGVLGYTELDAETIQAYLGWQKRRNGWAAEAAWFRFAPGVIRAINYLILALTEPGDGVAMLAPAYGSFVTAAEIHGRLAMRCPLKLAGTEYSIDWETLKDVLADPRCRIFILCNPHNPISRVYSEEELRRIGELCLAHGVFVISDEVHSDFIMPGYRHRVFASLDPCFAVNCAVCSAPSKSFNIAGLQFSAIMIPDEGIRARYDAVYKTYCNLRPNFFAPSAARAAWNEGEAWLEACKQYILGNYALVKETLESRAGGRIRVFPLQGCYIAWVDMRGIEPDGGKLRVRLLKEAKVAFDDGLMFGPEGEGFIRFNLASPRSVIEEILKRVCGLF